MIALIVVSDQNSFFGQLRGSGDGAVGRSLASHQCGPGSIP